MAKSDRAVYFVRHYSSEWIASNGYVITSPPRYSYVDGIWNQEDLEKWLTVSQVPVEKA